VPKPIRLSTSFTDGEVNVLDAMLESTKTGKFVNPENTLAFQTTARKILGLKTRLKAVKAEKRGPPEAGSRDAQ